MATTRYPAGYPARYPAYSASNPGNESGGTAAVDPILHDNFTDPDNNAKSIVNGVNNGAGASTHSFSTVNGGASGNWLQVSTDNGPRIDNGGGGFCENNGSTQRLAQCRLTADEMSGDVLVGYTTDLALNSTEEFYFGTTNGGATLAQGALYIVMNPASNNISINEYNGAGFDSLYSDTYTFPASGVVRFWIEKLSSGNVNIFEADGTSITGEVSVTYSVPTNNINMRVRQAGSGSNVYDFGVWQTSDPTLATVPS